MKKPGNLLRLLLTVLAMAFLVPVPAPAAGVPDFVSLAKELKPAVVNISTSRLVKPKRPRLPDSQIPRKRLLRPVLQPVFPGPAHGSRTRSAPWAPGSSSPRTATSSPTSTWSRGPTRSRCVWTTAAAYRRGQGADRKLDIALLKIDAGGDLPVARLGDSDALQVGEWVMAIGNPFGLVRDGDRRHRLGQGPGHRRRALRRFHPDRRLHQPRKFRGPALRIPGEVVGINTAIVAGGQGIGFAIPINEASRRYCRS